MNDQSKGYTSVIAMLIAVVTIVAKAHPEWHWMKLMADNIPQFTDILNYVVPTTAVVIAGLARPFHLLRAPLDRLKARLFPPLSPAQKDAMFERIQRRGDS